MLEGREVSGGAKKKNGSTSRRKKYETKGRAPYFTVKWNAYGGRQTPLTRKGHTLEMGLREEEQRTVTYRCVKQGEYQWREMGTIER